MKAPAPVCSAASAAMKPQLPRHVPRLVALPVHRRARGHVVVPVHHHLAAERLVNEVAPLPRRHRALLPEWREGDVHEPLVRLFQYLARQPQVPQPAPLAPVEQHVRLPQQPQERLAAFLGHQVEDDALLVGVVVPEVKARLAVPALGEPGGVAPRLCPARRLHQYHPRTRLREELAAPLRARPRQLHDGQVLERPAHVACASSSVIASSIVASALSRSSFSSE